MSVFYISIHSLRMEGDDVRIIAGIVFCISIHSLRMEGDEEQKREMEQSHVISIHSLRMEGDVIPNTIMNEFIKISIHSLRMEGDLWQRRFLIIRKIFQSTPSAWRET